MDDALVTSFHAFMDAYSAARTAVANANPAPIKALCSRRDDMSQCGFWGGVEQGWDEVSQRWDWVAAQFIPGPGDVTATTHLLTVEGTMAYGVFTEHWWCQTVHQTEPGTMLIRATLIFRYEDGAWKAVHRHGDDRITKTPPS